MSGPQQLLPQLTQFQPADTPERLEAFIARLHAYPAFMAANAELLRDGARVRADGAADRGRADDRPDRADARRSRSSRRSCRRWSRSPPTPTANASATSSATSSIPADPAFLDALRGEYLAATPRGARALVGARTARRSTGPRSAAGRRSTSTRRRSTGSASRSSSRSRPSAARSPARPASATTPPPTARRSTPTPPTRRRRRTSCVARATEDIERAMAVAPRFFGVLPTRRLRGPRRSRSTRRRTRPSPTTTRRRPDGSRPGIYYANGYDLPSRKYTKLATTTYHEAAPGHHFQITLEMENPHLNTFRRLGSRMVGGAYVEGWGLYSERLADEMGLFRDEARAVRDARRAGLARRPARRRHRPPRAALAAPALDRLPPLGRPVRDGRGHRDRPLHRVARPGADLQGRPARDRAAARRAGARATGRRSTCGPSTTRCSATARCRWRRSAASSRTGSPRRSDRRPGTARALHGHRDVPVRAGARLRPGGGTRAHAPARPALRRLVGGRGPARSAASSSWRPTTRTRSRRGSRPGRTWSRSRSCRSSTAPRRRPGPARRPGRGSERRVDRRRGHATTTAFPARTVAIKHVIRGPSAPFSRESR